MVLNLHEESVMTFKTLAILSALTAFAAAPAFAAETSNSTTSSNTTAPAPADSGHIGQNLRQDLTKAGFTDIHIAPEAYIVHAKNSSGDPVLMRIGPDAVTELTEVPTKSNHAANGTESSTSKVTGNTTHASK
jgi:hypothetical protein